MAFTMFVCGADNEAIQTDPSCKAGSVLTQGSDEVHVARNRVYEADYVFRTVFVVLQEGTSDEEEGFVGHF